MRVACDHSQYIAGHVTRGGRPLEGETSLELLAGDVKEDIFPDEADHVSGVKAERVAGLGLAGGVYRDRRGSGECHARNTEQLHRTRCVHREGSSVARPEPEHFKARVAEKNAACGRVDRAGRLLVGVLQERRTPAQE